MFYLELFGSPSVRRAEDGGSIRGRAGQRHRLALLAVLAISGARGMSRERLMALLWPDSDQERARNLLKVSVYVLRQAFGEDAVLSEGDELRLNPERIEVDVAAFERAIDKGDHERAVSLYRGPFLDAFFLTQAPEFERWVASERARLAGAYATSLELLAEGADARGDRRSAIEWWKARAAQDPYDSRVALRLMRVLHASGNPAGALQHAAAHEQLLREELGVEPAPEVHALVERLRFAQSIGDDGGRDSERSSSARKGDRASKRAGQLAAPFRLQTLGGLVLRGPNGRVRAADDCRDDVPLCLLAALAASGDNGIARDDLLLLFWPDASQHTARESLDQELAAIRTTIHESAVGGVDRLTLEPSVIASDVAEFEDALRHRQFDEAAECYTGPFLDGFRGDDSPELTQWVEAQRARLAAGFDVASAHIARVADHHRNDAAAAHDRATGTPGTSRRSHAVWYGAAAVALGALIAWWPGATPRTGGAPRIAILPLRNVSADPDYTTLADAMTEELTSMLGREPDKLRAISSSSVWRFRDRQTDVAAIAESLGVDYIVDGNLRKLDTSPRDGDPRVRLIVALVDGRDRSVRWTQPYEREYREILVEPANIARSVAQALGVRLASPIGRGLIPSPTGSGPLSDRRIHAFDLTIQGRRDVLLRTESGRRQALAFFRQAIEADSTYAAAHAELVPMLLSTATDSGESRRERLALAEKHARTTIRLDSTLALGHAVLGQVLLSDYQFSSAEQHLNRAIALDPTYPFFREFLVQLYVLQGRPQAALEQAERDVENNPHSTGAISELARAWLVSGRCDRAREILAPLEKLQPPPARAAPIAAQCYAQRQMWREAIDELRPVAERNPQASSWLGFMLARAGQTSEATQIRDRLLARHQRGDGGAFEVAMLYTGSRELDKAFEWLDRSIDDRSLRFTIMEPAFEELHRDPRFETLRQKLGIQTR